MNSFGKIVAATALLTSFGTVSAYADSCSGRNHDSGTAVGAVGGAAIGGLASHSIVGAVVGGVAGGLAGNAISRSNDCNRRVSNARERHYRVDRDGHRHYYYH
jgi:uncharacterized protein YcfJ